jgi:hypothetical protein
MSGETHWKELEQKIGQTVKLAKRPVAVALLQASPAGEFLRDAHARAFLATAG